MKKLFALLSIAPLLAACSGNPPVDLGLKGQTLKPCPDKPNCVNSFADKGDDKHAIEPIRPFAGQDLGALWTALPPTLKDKEIRIVELTDNYLRAEATTMIMRYVDDLEFYLDSNAAAIQVRSASRLGYSDLGKNRSRLEEIRAALQP
jgi:uncharacterized protein (DUF1499 family)